MKRTLALLATLLSVGLVRAMEEGIEKDGAGPLNEKDGAGPLNDNAWTRVLRRSLCTATEETQERSRETQERSRPGDDDHRPVRERSRSPRARVQQQTGFKPDDMSNMWPDDMSNMWTELESILPAGVKDTFKEFMAPDFPKKVQEDPNVLGNLFQKFDEISQDPALQEALDKFFDTPAFQQFMAAITRQRMAAAMAAAMQFALAAIPEMVAKSAPGTMHPVQGPVDQAGFNGPRLQVFMFGPPLPLGLPNRPENTPEPPREHALEEMDDGNLFKALGLPELPFANEEGMDGLFKALGQGIGSCLEQLIGNEEAQQLAKEAHSGAERDEVGAKAEEVHQPEMEQDPMKD